MLPIICWARAVHFVLRSCATIPVERVHQALVPHTTHPDPMSLQRHKPIVFSPTATYCNQRDVDSRIEKRREEKRERERERKRKREEAEAEEENKEETKRKEKWKREREREREREKERKEGEA